MPCIKIYAELDNIKFRKGKGHTRTLFKSFIQSKYVDIYMEREREREKENLTDAVHVEEAESLFEFGELIFGELIGHFLSCR